MSGAGGRARWLALVLWLGGAAAGALAHPTQFVTMQVKVEASGRFEALLNVDVLAYSVGKSSMDASNEELEAALDSSRQALTAALTAAGERFRREVVVRTDAGDAGSLTWKLPDLADVDAAQARKVVPRILIAGDIRFSGALPAGAQSISIRLPYVLGDTAQVYVVPGGDSDAQAVAAGEYPSAVRFGKSPPAVR